jgi:phosphoribosyl 1,2-cyclic phosphodiesterase
MYFNIISSGSKGNATVVVHNKTVILIDMGIAFSRLEEGFKEINLDPKDISAAIFTHNHSDHINGLKFIPIKKQYALEGTLPSTGHNVLTLFEEIQIGDIKITPIKAKHDAINPCGYVLTTDEDKLVYLTDTGVFEEDNIKYAHNADYIILESNHDIKMLMETNRTMALKKRIMSDYGHLCNEDSALASLRLIGPKTKQIVLAHLSEEANTKEKAIEAYQRVYQYFNEDLDKYNLRCAGQWTSLIGGNYEN